MYSIYLYDVIFIYMIHPLGLFLLMHLFGEVSRPSCNSQTVISQCVYFNMICIIK